MLGDKETMIGGYQMVFNSFGLMGMSWSSSVFRRLTSNRWRDAKLFRWIKSNRPTLNHYSILEDGKYCEKLFYDRRRASKRRSHIKLFWICTGCGIATAGFMLSKRAFQTGWDCMVYPNWKTWKQSRVVPRGWPAEDFPEYLIWRVRKTSIYMELQKLIPYN